MTTISSTANGTISIGRIQLSTGVELEYAEKGARDGVPVLLLHGITDSWRSYEPLMAELPDTMRVFALSQRGHGDSSRPAHGYRTRDFAADAAAFIEALDLGPALVVGHSMGSTNAARLALDYPQRLSGLVLIGAFASYAVHAGFVEWHASTIAPLQDPVPRELALGFQLDTLATPVAPAFLDMVVAESLKVPAGVWRAAFAGLLEDDFTTELGRISMPTHVIWGDRDAFVPRADQDRLLREIAHATYSEYAATGHAVHWEQPARVAADLEAFAQSIGLLTGMPRAVSGSALRGDRAPSV
ncbi:MAG TPA: alpha/beta hydrolase [Steroidobacteraceae bacterium]|nr:alpha/beta hydrolase [Steroidobacteraceae bacterium]